MSLLIGLEAKISEIIATVIKQTSNLRDRLKVSWGKVFKNGPSEICGRQPLKNLKWYGLLKQTIPLQIF